MRSFHWPLKWCLNGVIAGIVVFGLAVMAYLSTWGYYSLREKYVRHVYDAQSDVVDDAIQQFVRDLEAEGFQVLDHSERYGGSGDWRTIVAVTAQKNSAEPIVCYVEVQGFVAHNARDEPVWSKTLPMTISHQHRSKPLDDRFIRLLAMTIEQQRWQYEINDRCRGLNDFLNFGGDDRYKAE